VHATLFQAETFAILTCARKCRGNTYSGEHIYITHIASQAALWVFEALRLMSKLVWERGQALCVTSSWNKISLLWDTGHCGIQGNNYANALARG
jgi:hypothetical protein